MSARKDMLPYGRQCIGEEEAAAVAAVVRGEWLTTGPMVERFERAAAQATGGPHAVCCSSGTAGLHMAALAAGLGPGRCAVVPSITFLATANAARLAGAEVAFADVDPETGLMTADTLARSLVSLPRGGDEPGAVLAVHLGGQSCGMDEIAALARDRGLGIVEDAAHALGGTYDFAAGPGRVGDCRFSDMAVFSTHPVKSITTGEGGIVTTRDGEVAARLTRLRNHGMTRVPGEMVNADLAFDSEGALNPWYYEMHEVAPNYRLTDIQCALGTAQFAKLEQFIAVRRELARCYDSLLAGMAPAVRPLGGAQREGSAFHIYVVLIDFERLKRERAAVMAQLRDQGIGTQVHYIPVHLQPYYRDRYGFRQLPGAWSYYQRALTLPLFVGMTESDAERVAEALARALGLRRAG